MFTMVSHLYQIVVSHLNTLGNYFPPLLLRLILAWEFGTAGFEKLHGTNWFANIDFPFPLNLVSAEFSWNLSLGFEIVGAFALVVGFATRFFSISLFILTIVAIATVHWPEQWSSLSELWTGYRITDREGDGFGNYKLPLLYMIMFLPLIFSGPGKLSIDHFIKKYLVK
jgi:putative oxidoreductase